MSVGKLVCMYIQTLFYSHFVHHICIHVTMYVCTYIRTSLNYREYKVHIHLYIKPLVGNYINV